MSSSKLLGITGRGYEPRQKPAVFDQRLPSRDIPAHVLGRWSGTTRLAAQEHNDRIRLGRDETEEEDVLCAAVVALENGIAEGGLGVKLYFFMASPD